MDPFEIFVEIGDLEHTFIVFENLGNESFEVFDGDVLVGFFSSVSDEDYGIRWETTSLIPESLIKKIGEAIEQHFL